ncbi:MAG: hypothetical protein WD768_07550 [Phycisphaeraceae bacterium]
MNYNPYPLELETLDQPATWLNSGGKHIDRSACVEVRVAWVRKAAGCILTEMRSTWRKAKRCGVRELPFEKRVHSGIGRRATGVYTLRTSDLAGWMREMMPRRLAGDRRTARAMAMRPSLFKLQPEGTRHPTATSTEWKGFRCRRTSKRPLLEPDQGLSANPNRGASREKVLGLEERWTQPVRIERWVYEGRKLPAYYLICPGGTPSMRADVIRRHGFDPGPACGHGPTELEPGKMKGGGYDPRLPGLSTIGRGHKKKGCPQRVLFLYMPLCTKAEARDARTAQFWIESLPAVLKAKHAAFIKRLSERYGLFFSPRVLLCRACLGLRYGTDPETALRSYHRNKDRIAIRRRLHPPRRKPVVREPIVA